MIIGYDESKCMNCENCIADTCPSGIIGREIECTSFDGGDSIKYYGEIVQYIPQTDECIDCNNRVCDLCALELLPIVNG